MALHSWWMVGQDVWELVSAQTGPTSVHTIGVRSGELTGQARTLCCCLKALWDVRTGTVVLKQTDGRMVLEKKNWHRLKHSETVSLFVQISVDRDQLGTTDIWYPCPNNDTASSHLTLSYLPVQSSLSWPSLDPFLVACSIKAEETQLATVTELSTLMAAGTTPISFDDAEVWKWDLEKVDPL